MADRVVRIPIEAELDLHAFAPAEIRSVVEEYVEAAAAAGLREVRLVHGRGRGVQRGIVQAALERHAIVAPRFDSVSSQNSTTRAWRSGTIRSQISARRSRSCRSASPL